MSDVIGWIVRSTAGHDKGELFCVVGGEENILLLVDGKGRTCAKPKRKKRTHVDIIGRAPSSDLTIQTLQRGDPVPNSTMRAWLATFKGGKHAWQKTI